MSDNLNHDKYSVYANIKKIVGELLKKFPAIVKIKIFSDGCAAQFKNKYTLSMLCFLQEDFGLIHGEWLFFATSHGKGAVDGIGGLVKRFVWNEVKLRRANINCADDFLKSATKVSSRIDVIPLLEKEIQENIDFLNERWKNIRPIPGMQSKHYFCSSSKNRICASRTVVSTLEQFNVFKYQVADVYSDSEHEEELLVSDVTPPSQESMTLPVTMHSIKPGTYVLVKFTSPNKKHPTTYVYAAICQSPVEEDDEVKVMCMNVVGNSNGRIFKPNERDISYISYDQISAVLPPPILKHCGHRIVYEFPCQLNVYERG